MKRFEGRYLSYLAACANFLGQGTFDKLPTPIRAAMMDNAQVLKYETLSPGHFSTFSCEDAKKIRVPTLLLTGVFQRLNAQ